MYTGKEKTARFRHGQQSRFDRYLIDQYQRGDEPDPFDRRPIRIVYGGRRLALDLFDREPVASTASDDWYDAASAAVGVTAAADDSSAVTITPPTETPARVPPSREPSRMVAPRVEPVHAAEAEPFSWRRFAVGAAMGSIAAALVLAAISAVM
ncbi:MAG: hypothetical protein V3W34_13825 [Phycisphaerae bacterium]